MGLLRQNTLAEPRTPELSALLCRGCICQQTLKEARKQELSMLPCRGRICRGFGLREEITAFSLHSFDDCSPRCDGGIVKPAGENTNRLMDGARASSAER